MVGHYIGGFILFFLIALPVYAVVSIVLKVDEKRGDEWSERAERWWWRYKREWMTQKIHNERSQEYIEWLHEGRQEGFIE